MATCSPTVNPYVSSSRWVESKVDDESAPLISTTDCSGELTITKTEDLSTLSACSTYTGSITVQSVFLDTTPTKLPDGATLGISYPTIFIDRLERINGGLIFSDIAVSKGDGFSISSPPLKTVGSLKFKNMSALLMPESNKLAEADRIVFDQIKFVEQTVFDRQQWPALEAVLLISMTNTTVTKIGPWDRSLVVTTLSGIDPSFTPFLTLNVLSNPALRQLSVTGRNDKPSTIIAKLSNKR